MVEVPPVYISASAYDLYQFGRHFVRTVSFDYYVEFLLSQGSLVELSLLAIEDRESGLVVGMFSHVDVTF